MMADYPGDARMSECLKNYGTSVTVAELKAAMAGAIFGVKMVPPSAVFSILSAREDKPAGLNSKRDAEDFFGAVMGLWNHLAEFQEQGKVFHFSPLPKNLDEKNMESVLKVGRLRVSELDYFLEFLLESATPFGDEDDFRASEENPSSLPLVLESAAGILGDHILRIESGDTSEAWMITRTIQAMDEKMETLFPKFMSEIRAARLAYSLPGELDDDEEDGIPIVNLEPKAGRNDPCPCGSGLKYKRCSLQ